MKPLFPYIIKKIAIGLIFISIIMTFASCRSHKKLKGEERVVVEDVLKIDKKEGKSKKEKSIGEKIAEASLSWIGTPYGYGRSEKGVATDCSGMVVVLYEEEAGIKLPRVSSQQAEFCKDLAEKDVLPGDLVFFATGKDRKKISHVGIMLNGIQFVHASGSKGVIISEMTTPYYKRNFIQYGRVPR